jgi:methylated-DNA-[protein]-cysteine S-methyltransferase
MTATICYSYFDSPLGEILLVGDGQFVTGLYMPQHRGRPGLDSTWKQSDAPFIAVHQQLAEYFAGRRQAFDVPLKLAGTRFQQRVWRELVGIPFGTTISYGDLARRIDQPTASRAVGAANGRNPISIIVPCHRVIGSGSTLTGYGGGLDKKAWLLDWERGVEIGRAIDRADMMRTSCLKN